MGPVVRHWIVCENVQQSSNPEQFTIVNVICRIRVLDRDPFPLLYRELCFLAICTECRGKSVMKLEITEDDTGRSCYESRDWLITFEDDPLQIYGLPFRIRNLSFPSPGIYTARLLHNGRSAAEEPLRISE